MSTLLAQLLQESDASTLWIADENCKSLLQPGVHFPGVLLSNRWDIARQAKACGLSTLFNDFDLWAAGNNFSRILYPVSKEKAAVHHVINSAPQVLAPGGALYLLGNKNSGIKTYAQKAAQRFATNKNLRKQGNEYLSITAPQAGSADTTSLDDGHYRELQQPQALEGLYSKPGLFGWDKIDTGSALLAEHFNDENLQPGTHVVDLGCGYGYLSAKLAERGTFNLTATDNNAAALRACRKNFSEREISSPDNVVPGDAGSELPGSSTDFVICNPPFHQGFQVEGDLTDLFLKQAARILTSNGKALFVVNEFIPLGRKAQSHFRGTSLLAREKGFCVYRLEK